ncbi:hypothetical protein N7516_009633 [Penicillium verrucosum]|uniref:uncharacterized protein n=1 Tax=Penicillium verrucosum TaxID=60171 RepID=UPI002545A166|nr:uncharacterized protein N7516_009633 [Penicillium verrucosum]KAJ5921930.1 hypothetical protein N7516_009633 [Penicillium verrucosum]
MSRYDDYRSSTGTLDSRDRYDRYSRGPPWPNDPAIPKSALKSASARKTDMAPCACTREIL